MTITFVNKEWRPTTIWVGYIEGKNPETISSKNLIYLYSSSALNLYFFDKDKKIENLVGIPLINNIDTTTIQYTINQDLPTYPYDAYISLAPLYGEDSGVYAKFVVNI
jgi:hypothetical protein